ncbi:1-deoxy-D-xylulose-5-phosphate reductoisomerase [Rhodobacteraceae bacterium NNCM2]|nr:1-deoxy-D-xylulose-5-phosphate reductoisomerase [Coraliihabitans acroporae]
MKRISILGVTGSIGANTVNVVEALGRDQFNTVAVTGNANIDGLADAARRLGAEVAVTADPSRLGELREALAGSGIEAAAGQEALVEAASRPADWVMSAIVGAAGLAPTLAAARMGATIALANKETLVAAGGLFLAEVEKSGASLLPVDSEHNALFQCMAAETGRMERLILTASGGPFRNHTLDQMRRVTVAEAVAHPNWSMGQRISIDSASMFNKSLEMIEAWHLFDVTPEQIEVIVHPQSIIHSMVGFCDGTILAHLGPADMRVAIGYALNYPERKELPVERVDFAALARLDFQQPDTERFPSMALAQQAMVPGVAGCVLNGAHEVALDGFIDGRIGFLDMAALVEETMTALDSLPIANCLEDIYDVDAQARRVGIELMGRFAA